MTISTISRRLAVALIPLALASGCGGSAAQLNHGAASHTLTDVGGCFNDHGARVTATSGSDQADPDAQVISDFMGYQGTLSGSYHGIYFTVDVFDDSVYLDPEVPGYEDTFASLGDCFDGFGGDPSP